MSTIIGLRTEKGKTWLVADRRLVDGGNVALAWSWKILVSPDRKRAVAFSGWDKVRHVARLCGMDPEFWLGDLHLAVDWLETRIKQTDWKPRYDGDNTSGPAGYGISALWAWDGALWLMAADFGLTEVPCGELAAIGSGQDFAYGAWYTLQDRFDAFKPDADTMSESLCDIIRAAAFYDVNTGVLTQIVCIPAAAD